MKTAEAISRATTRPKFDRCRGTFNRSNSLGLRVTADFAPQMFHVVGTNGRLCVPQGSEVCNGYRRVPRLPGIPSHRCCNAV